MRGLKGRVWGEGAREGLTHGAAEPAHPQALKESFAHAFAGLWDALRSQRNLRIQVACGAVALLVGAWLRLSAWEMALLAGVVGLILVAETFNTALEALVDGMIPTAHPQAKRAKDVAAAAVLLAALTGVVVGGLLFGPRLLSILGR